jgi:hypothetical protein
MGFSCIKCKKFTTDLKFIAKKTQPKKFDDYTKIGVCTTCYDKRQKWMKSRGLA